MHFTRLSEQCWESKSVYHEGAGLGWEFGSNECLSKRVGRLHVSYEQHACDHTPVFCLWLFAFRTSVGGIALSGRTALVVNDNFEISGDVVCADGGCSSLKTTSTGKLFNFHNDLMCAAPDSHGDVCQASVRLCVVKLSSFVRTNVRAHTWHKHLHIAGYNLADLGYSSGWWL